VAAGALRAAESLSELLPGCSKLTLLELADADAEPAFGGANQCRIDQLQDGPLTEGVRDDLGASWLLAEQPLQEIGGADRPAMAEREAQIRDAGLKFILETGRCARQIAAVRGPGVVAQQQRQGRRGRLVAGHRVGLELGPAVFRRFLVRLRILCRQAALPQRAHSRSGISLTAVRLNGPALSSNGASVLLR
jgi:hypothetical protein